jgi:hypothetical protein
MVADHPGGTSNTGYWDKQKFMGSSILNFYLQNFSNFTHLPYSFRYISYIFISDAYWFGALVGL